MNTLELIRNRILRTKHLDDAQMLMARSYRGVAHVDAHHDQPAAGRETSERTDRVQRHAR